MAKSVKPAHDIMVSDVSITVESGDNLLASMQRNGIEVSTDCGGTGTCGKCKVRLEPAPAPTEAERTVLSAEDIREGWRLACQQSVSSDLCIHLPAGDDGSIRVLREGFRAPYPHDPPALRDLGHGHDTKRAFGAAVDIGTTTLVVVLVALASGEEISLQSTRNPQRVFGSDVFSRARYAQTEHGLENLRALLVQAINDLLSQAVRQAGIDRRDILEACIAGNQFMLRFLLGEDTGDITRPPYVSKSTESVSVRSQQLRIDIAEEGRVYLLPSASAFIGADIVAGLVAIDIEGQDRPALFMDLGTNGELVLADHEGLYACSTAAGPAFEGMNISCGIGAVDGAVESVLLDREKGSMSLEVVGDAEPRGLCGSGLIAMVAELFKIGLIDETGRYVTSAGPVDFGDNDYHGTVQAEETGHYFEISRNDTGKPLLRISQRDIRELQLARAAVKAGIDILLGERGLKEEELRRVLVAGAFGHRLRPESLARLGLLSVEASRRVQAVGNTSLSGAYLTLVSQEARDKSERLAKSIHSINLSLHPEFENTFLRHMRFPRTTEEV